MTSVPKSPPPPLLFLACLLGGWGLGRWRPLVLGLPAGPRLAVGTALLLLALGLGAWALRTFRRGGTTPEPNGTATTLLTTGPFRFSRNPLYLSLSLLLTGLGLLLDIGWILLLVPLLALMLDRRVIVREEARLQAQFGEAYAAYRRRVRRWI